MPSLPTFRFWREQVTSWEGVGHPPPPLPLPPFCLGFSTRPQPAPHCVMALVCLSTKWAQKLFLPCWVEGVPYREGAPATYSSPIPSPSTLPARFLGVSSTPPAFFGTNLHLLVTPPPHFPWNSVLSSLIWTPAPTSSTACFLPGSCEPFHAPNTRSPVFLYFKPFKGSPSPWIYR